MKDLLGINFRLTEERWKHIIRRHPEIKAKKKFISRTLAKPDIIVVSKLDPSVHIYQSKREDDYYFTVVVHTLDRFIITAYITNQIKRGVVLWKKPKINN